jgi:hypothetical protein
MMILQPEKGLQKCGKVLAWKWIEAIDLTKP